MLAMDRVFVDDPNVRDLERELADSLEHRGGSQGLFSLTRRMDPEDEDHEYDIDVTILDFLAYKAVDLVFEWRASSNPHSDLPSALVTMTAGTPSPKHIPPPCWSLSIPSPSASPSPRRNWTA